MESSSSNAAEVNVKILYVRGGWRKTKPKHEWRWERFARIKRFCITYWETQTSSRKQTLNSCFQTQFLSLHILTCRLDISIVQRMNTWQLPHELFHCFSFFFSLVLVTFIFLSRTGNTLTLPERKRHEKTERKKPFKAAAQTRTAFIDRQTKGLNASGTGTDEASVLKMTFSKQLIYLQPVSPCSLQYGSVMNTALYSTSGKMQHSCCRNVFFYWEASDGERSASDWKLPEGVNSSAETDSLKLSCKLSFDKRQRCSADKLII